MEISLLGPLGVSLHGRSIVPTASKPRQVLAMLAVNAGQIVPAERIADELWAGRPPRSASTTLQTYVMQLRALITDALTAAGDPADAKDHLRTFANGYQLEVGDGHVDAVDFDVMTAEAFAAKESGDTAAAVERFRSALALWHGPALVDIPAGPVLEIVICCLDEAHLCAVDARVEMELALGRHRSIIASLAQLTALHPTNERLYAQYMVALCRSGRRGEALAAYNRLRATLVRELGLEPSPTLKRVQRGVLTSTLGATDWNDTGGGAHPVRADGSLRMPAGA